MPYKSSRWYSSTSHTARLTENATHMNQSCHTCSWVMSHIPMSHVTSISESCHTCQVMSHISTTCRPWQRVLCLISTAVQSAVYPILILPPLRYYQSCHTHQRVMSRISMSHVTHTNESCHTYQWVMSHISTSHVTHINESCHTYERVMSHIWTSHVTQIRTEAMTECVTSHVWMNIYIYIHIYETYLARYFSFYICLSARCVSFYICLSEICLILTRRDS